MTTWDAQSTSSSTMWSIAHRCKRVALRGEYGSVDRERVDRRVHACEMTQASVDNRSMRTVYGTDQLLKKWKLSGRSLMADATLWPVSESRLLNN